MKIFVAAAVLAAGAVVSAQSPASAAVPQYRACPTEDSQRCVWRANVRGNGEGQSFVAGNGEGRLTFVRHRIARNVLRADHWRRVPDRMVGRRVDAVDKLGGTWVVSKNTVWSVGDTTYLIKPWRGRVASS